MANYINKYTNIEAYNADDGKQYPNVSYLVATDEVKWVKDDPDHIVCVYDVTSTESATKLLLNTTNISKMWIDSVEQPSVVDSYTFDTLGEHIVKYTLADPTTIGNLAFKECTGLTSVSIPNSVTSIGNAAFLSCTGLTSVTIPNSVTSIGINAFGGCTGLTAIDVDENNTAYSSINGVLFNKSKTELVRYPGGKQGAYTILNSVTSIVRSAFNGCTGLTSVTIGNSVTSIGINAFYGCTGFTSVTIGNSVTSIGNQAFGECTGLTSVSIPNSVTSIGDWAFVECTGLTSITVEPTTPPTLGEDTFSETNNCPIYVPSESVETYKTATNWSTYASRIKPISE